MKKSSHRNKKQLKKDDLWVALRDAKIACDSRRHEFDIADALDAIWPIISKEKKMNKEKTDTLIEDGLVIATRMMHFLHKGIVAVADEVEYLHGKLDNRTNKKNEPPVSGGG